jgi:hypothetical protein
VVTDAFRTLAEGAAAAGGMPDLPVVTVPHPIGPLPRSRMAALADEALDGILEAVGRPRARVSALGHRQAVNGGAAGAALATAELTLDADDALLTLDAFEERQWTDGLPVVPPTRERVARFLEAAGVRDPHRLIAWLPPRGGAVTPETLAVNAVMAGCRPEALPVLWAAVEAMCDPAFDLPGVQATTNPGTPLLIVSGPVAAELGINSGYNVLGPGWRANATIGRAVRLLLHNVGGGRPGRLDRSTQGTPAKYGLCIGENLASSPWPPLHTERGVRPEESAVTVVAVAGTQDITTIHAPAKDPAGVLLPTAWAMAGVGLANVGRGGEFVVVFGPEHAAVLGQAGWDRRRAAGYLSEHAAVVLDRFDADQLEAWRSFRADRASDGSVRDGLGFVVRDPGEVLMVVAGGPGARSTCMPTFGYSHAVTRPVRGPAA